MVLREIPPAKNRNHRPSKQGPQKKVHGERRKEERHRSDGGFHCGDEYSSQAVWGEFFFKQDSGMSDVFGNSSSGDNDGNG